LALQDYIQDLSQEVAEIEEILRTEPSTAEDKWNGDLAAVAIIWDNLDTFLLALFKVSMTGMHESSKKVSG
jgi:hypothetical protein